MFKFLSKKFGNTLFFKGCMLSYICPEIAENYRILLNKMGIDFIELPSELCCGRPLISAGFQDTFKKQKAKLTKEFEKLSVNKVLSACPACYLTLGEIFEGSITNTFILRKLLEYISKGKIELKPKFSGMKATFHDPCHLARYAKLCDIPRKLLAQLGFEIVEMKFSRERTKCCGAGAGVKANFPELANAIAKERIKEARNTKAEILITSCPLCYMHLKENSSDIKVAEISEVLVEGLK